MNILDDLDKENLKNCENLSLTVFKGIIYLDNWNYEQGCLEEIITINYTEN